MDAVRGDLGAEAAKVLQHEEAAHEKRNWVRLTFDCNNHCVFCLDTLTHDGQMRDREDVKDQILDGRKKGAARLILSGGEPTIHPSFVDFIRLGRMAGYRWIQTVTNGRMFAYPQFLARCADAGLNEITFSVHGPNARIHDALVGVKGAFDQEMRGLENALADGRLVVNIDVVVNRVNVRHLAEMLEKFIAMGVREFDLLQVIPFGNAFTEGRDTLFYDLEDARPHLVAAFEFSRRPDVHIWCNRFPVQHLEGYEHLIQDPYKLNDEVRGRQEEFALLLEHDTPLDCRQPERCRYCYLQRLCDTLDDVRALVAGRRFEVVRVDAGWEAHQAPPLRGDPASTRRARLDRETGRLHLPLAEGPPPPTVPAVRPSELAAAAGARRLVVVAGDLPRALEVAAGFPSVPELELELADYAGLAAALVEGRVGGKTIVGVVAATAAQARELLAIDGAFEVVALLNHDTAAWLTGLEAAPARLALRQPTYERLSESAANDVDLRALFAGLRQPVPVEGVPACVTGYPPRPRPATLDAAMMTPDGRLEIFRYTKRYVLDHYFAKSLRCKGCRHEAECRGMHINYVRAHGYGIMQPV